MYIASLSSFMLCCSVLTIFTSNQIMKKQNKEAYKETKLSKIVWYSCRKQVTFSIFILSLYFSISVFQAFEIVFDNSF